MRDFWSRRFPLILSGVALVLVLARADGPKAPPEALAAPPLVSAVAWAVVDAKTGSLVAGDHSTARRAIASTTKIMTAWLVLRLADADPKVLDESVTFSERADKTIGTMAGLSAGESIPVRELLYGLLLPSGNDAAAALAEHFGPRLPPAKVPPASALGEGAAAEARFVAAMNREAERLQLADTSYLDPHGLGANLSTAADLAALARACYANPRFRTVVNTRRHTADIRTIDGGTRAVTWENTNRLLDIEGYDGVKTGTTNAAGACLVSSGRRGDDHLFVAVLGASTGAGRYADTRNLFRWAWRQRGHADEPAARP